MSMYTYNELHRKSANLIMTVSIIYWAIISLISSFLPYPCTLPEGLEFSANLSFDMFFLGLYLKSCYRFIWKGSGFTKIKAYTCIIFPIILFLMIVIREMYAPSIIGPVSWYCREYGFGWFYNWRLWWISSVIDQVLTRSALIIYATVIIRKIIENYSCKMIDRNNANS